jgi:HD-like signal output (HDOD) protein
MHSEGEIRSVVERIQKLPTLPEIGVSILDLAADPEVSMEAMAEAINRDPSLAARVLKVANSPFYGMPRQVDSLQLALVILGLSEVRNIALGIMILKVIKGLDTHVTYDRDKFWTHSLGCGIAARILSRKLHLRNDGADFIVGLLHDTGKIIIDEYFSEDFLKIHDASMQSHCSMIEAEKRFLGESHERIGGWLAEKWRLPETLCEAIIHHHDLSLPGLERSLIDPRNAALAYLAEAFCGCHEVGWDGDAGCNEIKDERAWGLLLSGQDEYSYDDVDSILEETLQEFEDTPLQLLH